ncbi:MAG: hypothetical protein ACOX5Z_09670 [Desulfobulbus sp.]|jgi:hypothetical protein
MHEEYEMTPAGNGVSEGMAPAESEQGGPRRRSGKGEEEIGTESATVTGHESEESAAAHGEGGARSGNSGAKGQEPRHRWAPQEPQPLPPGYVLDPSTGRIVYVGATQGQPIYPGEPVFREQAASPLPPGYALDPSTGRIFYVGATQGQPIYPGEPVFREQAASPLPPGYALDPATGRVVYVGAAQGQPVYPGDAAFAGQVAGQGVPPQPETAEELEARRFAEQQRHGQIIQSVEQFVGGEATLSDVVRTVYANTAGNDQLWKGVAIGAAGAILLSSPAVREAMGKTFGALFPGLSGAGAHKTEPAEGAASAAHTTSDDGGKI